MIAVGSATAALALWVTNAAAFAPSSTPTGDWTILGGVVDAVTRSGDAVYLGGKFQALARHAPGIAAFGPESGALEAPSVRLDAIDATPITVSAVTTAPDGGVYVAGAFAGAGGVRQGRLLRFTPTGALDPAFRPSIPGARILDMDVGADGVLYLAGTFTTVGGQPRAHVAAVDGATGAVTAWRPVVDQQVTQLEAGLDAVYVAGDFTTVGGQPRARVGAVDTELGGVLPWRADTDADGAVSALAISGSTVYLGGAFATVAGVPRSGLAAVDATTGAPRASWDPAPSGPVTRIAVSGSRVVVAGSFIRIGAHDPGQAQPSRRFLAAIDATTGAALPWDPLASRAPSDIAVHDDRVYLSWAANLSSGLPRIGGDVRCGLASVDIDPATGAATTTPWDPGVETDNAATGSSCNPELGFYRSGTAVLAIAGGRVWAGGDFTVAQVLRRTGLAALDARTEQPLPWAPRLAGGGLSGTDVVHDLAASPDGRTVYIGGAFSIVDGQTRTNAAAVSSAGALTAWNPAANGVVRTLAVGPGGGQVYLGGDFTRAGRDDRPRLAAVDSGAGLNATPWRPAPDAPVFDLLVDDAAQRLLVAGRFRTIARAADRLDRTGLATADIGATPADPRIEDWDAGLEDGAAVEGLALRGTELVAGGLFTTSGGQANLGAFDLTSAEAATWTPRVDGRVQAVAVDPADGTAYITGAFSAVGGAPRAGAAAVDVDGAPTGWDPAPARNFPQSDSDRLVPPGGPLLLDERLLLTGAFTVVGGLPQGGFALFGPAGPPIAVSPPSIAGSPQLGQTLTCQIGRWSGDAGTRSFAWLRDGTVVAGAVGSRYIIGARDLGSALGCRETIANAAATISQDSLPVTVVKIAPVLDSAPAVAGQPWAGGTARCTTGLWRNAPENFMYRWLLDDMPIPGATSDSYDVAAAQQGRTLACDVTAVNAGGASAAARSTTVTITEAPPAAVGSPLITGDPRVGGSLSCTPGAWERARGFAYQWLRDRVPLVDATSPTFVATSRDLGRALTCLVTADNAGGTTSAESFAAVVLASAHSEGTGRRPNPPDDGGPASAESARPRAFDIRSARLRSRRTVAVALVAPAAGRITVSVVRTTKVKAGSKVKTKTTTLARGSRTLRRAATSATVQLSLSAAARRLVAGAGRRGLRVTIRASFRPAKGAASSDRMTATLTTPATRG